MKKIMLIGANGLLGTEIVKHFANTTFELLPLGREQLDICDASAVKTKITSFNPDVIMNCSAYMGADECEANPSVSYLTNVQGVKNLVAAVQQVNPVITLFHFSTDFVFDGEKGDYLETDIPNPKNIYGWHKWGSEEILMAARLENYYILRVASLLGPNPAKTDFSKTILKLFYTRKDLKIVGDMNISISTTPFVASIAEKIINTKPTAGLYHCVSSGKTNWYELTQFLVDLMGYEGKLEKSLHKDYPYKAPRPVNSNLINHQLAEQLQQELPIWQIVVRELIETNKNFYKNWCEQ